MILCLYKTIVLSVFCYSSLIANQTSSKYFPYHKDSSYYTYNAHRYQVTTAAHYYKASNAFDRNKQKHRGIHELDGLYNLNDVIESYNTINPEKKLTVIPNIIQEAGNNLTPEDLNFRLKSSVTGLGFCIDQRYKITDYISCSVSVPFVHITSWINYQPAGRIDTDQLRERVDKQRRVFHDLVGFYKNKWEQSGFGDIDISCAIGKTYHHCFLTRSISIAAQLGYIPHTSARQDYNNPASLPFMGNGHNGIYLTTSLHSELKYDLVFGIWNSLLLQDRQTDIKRIAVGKEPDRFSSLITPVTTKPGSTLSFNPFLEFGNIVDGLNVHIGYHYVRHNQDDIKCYHANVFMNNNALDAYVIGEKLRLSSWRSHTITGKITYDPEQAKNNKLWLSPKLFVTADMPFGGKGISKTYNVSLGIVLNY